MLARWAGAPYEEVRYESAGINHQAWILSLTHRGEDLYPRVRQAARDPQIRGSEPVRIALMEQFGYFVTESSGHASEYSPYFRKTTPMIEDLAATFTSPRDEWFDWGRTGGYLRECRRRLPTFLDEVEEQIAGRKPLPERRSHEYGAAIVNAMETDEALTIYGNVPNASLITNLPPGCCVEVACLVKGNGVHPTVVGALPPQLAALNRTNINVQELAVHGSLHGDREAIVHAAMLDPLTAAVCTLDQVRAMVGELFEAQERWLPQFGPARQTISL
jgi:alpha-galactosidase